MSQIPCPVPFFFCPFLSSFTPDIYTSIVSYELQSGPSLFSLLRVDP
jgi:hypothetical protein